MQTIAMKTMTRLLIGFLCALLLSGCSAKRPMPDAAGAIMPRAETSTMTEVHPDRLLIWKARLTLEVSDVRHAATAAIAVTERQGGFVGQKTESGENSEYLTLRIPTKAFASALTDLEALGVVTYRNMEGEDVTEQYIDNEARLKNKLALRARLRQLLEKATDIKDLLAIETELNRVQSDIDSMAGRLKALKNMVEYATVTLSLEKKTIPGPLGYLFSGLWWGVKKLFVIRD